ncbi:MAG: cold shock domain-containing protein [Phycisphaerae bacterium]|nr:cold shock domain-containing protein [Phycisphaerae bacterium]
MSTQPVVGSTQDTLSGCEGVVKWFDPRKGFGFVVGPDSQDIFIHFSVIEQAEGFRTLKDGEKIVYSAQRGAKGWSATAIRAAARVRASDTGPNGDKGPAGGNH